MAGGGPEGVTSGTIWDKASPSTTWASHTESGDAPPWISTKLYAYDKLGISLDDIKMTKSKTNI